MRDIADAAGGSRVQPAPLLEAIAPVPSSRCPNSSTVEPAADTRVQPAAPTTASATFCPSQPVVAHRPPVQRATTPAWRRSLGRGS